MPLDNLIHCSTTKIFDSVFHLDQMNTLSPLNVPKICFGIHIIFFVNQRTKVTQAMQQDFKVVPSIPHYVQAESKSFLAKTNSVLRFYLNAS